MTASLLPTPEDSATVTEGVGGGVTVIVLVVEAVQPFALVTVTVYVEVVVGITVIEAELLPVLHSREPAPAAVSIASEPRQIAPSLSATPDVSVIETEGGVSISTVMVVDAVEVAPFE